MATVKWSPLSLPLTILGNELTGLATGGLSVTGTTVQADGNLYCDFEFVAGSAISPTAFAAIDIWMLRSIDGGASYVDGSASVTPSQDPSATISVRQGTLIVPRAGTPMVVLPPGLYKPMARNRLGVNIPSGSIIRMATYSEMAA
jgi:hypothetical protein